MQQASTRQTLIEAGRLLRQSAKRHKRLERLHREAAQETMKSLAAYASQLEELGIQFDFVADIDEESQSNHARPSRAAAS